MTVEHIISLLESCVNTTYFQFQGRFLEQIQVAAMGPTISTIVTNLYIEDFDTKAINPVEHPLRL